MLRKTTPRPRIAKPGFGSELAKLRLRQRELRSDIDHEIIAEAAAHAGRLSVDRNAVRPKQTEKRLRLELALIEVGNCIDRISKPNRRHVGKHEVMARLFRDDVLERYENYAAFKSDGARVRFSTIKQLINSNELHNAKPNIGAAYEIVNQLQQISDAILQRQPPFLTGDSK
ncbi:MAG: hypothetical protein ACHQX3_02030 [Nitrospirales bacterium]